MGHVKRQRMGSPYPLGFSHIITFKKMISFLSHAMRDLVTDINRKHYQPSATSPIIHNTMVTSASRHTNNILDLGLSRLTSLHQLESYQNSGLLCVALKIQQFVKQQQTLILNSFPWCTNTTHRPYAISEFNRSIILEQLTVSVSTQKHSSAVANI